MSNQLPPEPQKKSCLERAIIFSIRLLFAFVVGIAIGVGIYFGIRLLYSEYQTLTQDYESRISAVEASQSQSNQVVTDRMSSYQTRLESLEIQGDTQKDAIANLESRLETHDEFRSYQATVVAGQQDKLLNMEDTLLAIQNDVKTIQSDLESIQSDLSNFQNDIRTLQSSTDDLEKTVKEIQETNETTVEAINEMMMETEARMTILENKMSFLVAMELMTRARLNMVQGNLTLAQSDLESARSLLVTLQEDLPPIQAAYVEGIIAGIDDLLGFLPGAPITAADKLEGVWQMLAAGLPVEGESTIETSEESTPTPTLSITPTPEP
jgi:DNA repair exonuclease SbcCD ATPase subunit